jgi:L-2-hydroxyglutarate oxidase LhgO
MENVDVVVIGAGVVGLASARALALRGREVLVLESEAAIGTGTSARNSEVIHAGLDYAPGSLKAQHCVAGKPMLYAYLRERGIGHLQCGKLIVATSAAQVPQLARMQANAGACGMPETQLLSAEQAMALQPGLRCVGALSSPSTGIVDSHGLMLSLQGDLEHAAGSVVLNTPVSSAQITDTGTVIHTGGADPMALHARTVVNCAGLYAQAVAARMQGFPSQHVPPTHYAKGNYFSYTGKVPFSQLIYPLPEAAGWGVHLTLDLAGQARFGPDVQWVDHLNYDVDPSRAASFYASIRSFWPDLPDGSLQPSYSGIRPKIQAPGEKSKDYCIIGPKDHGVAGMVHLFGIESPGLTSCLSIGQHVADLLQQI